MPGLSGWSLDMRPAPPSLASLSTTSYVIHPSAWKVLSPKLARGICSWHHDANKLALTAQEGKNNGIQSSDWHMETHVLGEQEPRRWSDQLPARRGCKRLHHLQRGW